MAASDGFGRLKQRWEGERLERERLSGRLRALVLEKGAPVFERYGVRQVFLFGSVAAGRARPDSDIDLLAIPLGAEDYWLCRRDLEAALGRSLDLHTQGDDPVFVRKIMERGELIYEVRPGTA